MLRSKILKNGLLIFFKNIIFYRKKQWVKNLLVFAAAIFSFEISKEIILNLFSSFISFCLISNSIYLFNDIRDIENDRKHPLKKFRPIASGKLSIGNAYLSLIFLFLISLFIGLNVNYYTFLVLIFYFIIQILYSLKLKNQPILDLVCISSGFTLRAIAGVIAVGIKCSPWFILSVGLLAYFLVIEKRKAELKYFGIWSKQEKF